ncbi:unnamed protein product [Cyclocybe aegerita]|uniref:Knr4/Smi1-like domain-containing protein n=1 Tax=Cyclocybe aegerita TaxID=1973307 RepID=A0A8S0X2R4_CYCAE|nr:unnamed protein product [Cyclocybe aegerita]
MGWLSSLFSLDKTPQRPRTGQVFSSTHEAFSLPTSSPVFASHPDAFNPDTLNTPDPESARSPATYTYPPQGPGAYGYIPSSAGFGSRPASSSLLPTHMDPLHTPLSAYPPLSKSWARIRNWLSREYPELGDTLNYGILPQDLAQIEMQFGFALPGVVRESYLCVDGQEAESAAGCSEGLFFGLTLLPLESVLEEWRFWREVDHDPSTGANLKLRESMQSLPPNWVRKEYSQRGWIPLIADKVGNYVGVDLNPAESGSPGQVIVFGRDFDTKVVLWRGDGPTGWAKWLASFAEELESGEGFEIGNNDASEGSEDELGYENYFYDGNGRGQGDGGGDNGAGGLHYTGEYRGWSVLEAWADRSLRKWHEAGVIPDEALMPPEELVNKKPEDLDIVDISQQGSGVEIPIPILSSSHEHIPSPTVGALNHHSRESQSGPSSSKQKNKAPAHVPTISVTKPPAPRPVELPTFSDIAPFPSPPESGHSSLEDLETGRMSTGMREASEDVGLVTATRRTGKSPIRRETSDTIGSALPPTPPPSDTQLASSKHSTSKSPSPAPPIIPDLLEDSVPAAIEKKPLEPLAVPQNVTSSSENVPQVQLELTQATSSTSTHVLEEEEDDAPPDTTIRLIGGGGESGIAQSPVEMTHEEAADAQVEVEAEAAAPQDGEAAPEVTSANKKDEKAHKKTKSSLASLKRISQIAGGSKKKDSTSGIKEVVSTSSK